MKKQRKHYTSEEEIAILRRHLLEKEPISKLCDELGLQFGGVVRWPFLLEGRRPILEELLLPAVEDRGHPPLIAGGVSMLGATAGGVAIVRDRKIATRISKIWKLRTREPLPSGLVFRGLKTNVEKENSK